MTNAVAVAVADLKYAFRGLRRSPLFASVAILSLALGIGASTAVFTLIDQNLFRQLPVKAPGVSEGRLSQEEHYVSLP